MTTNSLNLSATPASTTVVTKLVPEKSEVKSSQLNYTAAAETKSLQEYIDLIEPALLNYLSHHDNTKTNLLSYLKIIVDMRCGNDLHKDQAYDAYILATALRHHPTYLKRAWNLFNLVLSHEVPGWLKAKCYFGMTKMKDRKGYKEAAKYFAYLAIENHPESMEAPLWLGQSTLIDKQERIKLLEKILDVNQDKKFDRNYSRALIELGNLDHTDNLHRTRACWYEEAEKLSHINGHHRTEVNALIALAKSQPQAQAYAIYDKALKVARLSAQPKIIALALIKLGSVYYNRASIDYFQEALKKLGDYQDDNLKAQAYLGLGKIHDKNLDQPRQTYLLKALEILGDHGQITLRIETNLELGDLRYTDADHSRASWYLAARDIAQKVSNLHVYQAEAYIALANMNYVDDKHKNNIDWLLDAKAVIEKAKKPWTRKLCRMMAKACFGLGDARYTDGQHHARADWYHEGLDLIKGLNDHYMEARLYIGLGYSVLGHNDYSDEYARECFTKALALTNSLGNKNLQDACLIGLKKLR